MTFAQGPDGRKQGSTQFTGRPNSYVEIPYSRKIDAKNSITILAWVFHSGNSGPIVNYRTKGFGVHFWMTAKKQLFVRFTSRRGRQPTPVTSRTVHYKAWNYVGATYNKRTGVAKLYVNYRLVARRRIGRMSLATNYPIRIGAIDNDGRRLKGRVFCVQVYGQPLTLAQIKRVAKICFKKGKLHFHFMYYLAAH